MNVQTWILFMNIIFLIGVTLIFLGIYFVGSYLIGYFKRFRDSRLLDSTEYLPEEEIQTLKQVFYLIILTICFVDIVYALIFLTSPDFYIYFIVYDILASLVACLAMKRDTRTEKLVIICLVPISTFLYMFINGTQIAIILLMIIHILGLIYVIKEYYGKFIHFTESNGLGISILLLFGIVFLSFIFTSFVEDANLLDSLVMVSNAFTSNGYAVLGHTALGKLNSIVLVWGGYILSGAGTATLTVAIMSRHFNKRFDDLEEMIRNNGIVNDESKNNDGDKNHISSEEKDEDEKNPIAKEENKNGKDE